MPPRTTFLSYWYIIYIRSPQDGNHLAVLESEGVGLLWSPDRTKQNILGERTSCRTTYTRYRIRIVWTLLGKSISTISTTSITAKYAGVQMGWHRFKIVLSSPRMQPWIPGRHHRPKISTSPFVLYGSVKMEKPILKRLTVNSRFSWWKSQKTGNTISIRDRAVRSGRPRKPGYFYHLICLSNSYHIGYYRLSLYPFPPKSIFSYSFNISPSSGSSLLPSYGRRFGFRPDL